MDPEVSAAFGGSQPSPSMLSASSDSEITQAFGQQPQLKQAPASLIASDKPIEEGNPVTYGLGLANSWVGGELSKGARALGMTDPASLRDVSNIPAAAEAVLGARIGRIRGEAPGAPEVAPPSAEHPLAQAAAAEDQRLTQIKQAGQQAGLQLPEGGTPAAHAAAAATNQPISNAMTREEIGLPPGARITPPLLDKARATYGAPAYQAIQNYPEPIPLGENYQQAIQAAHDDNMNAAPNARLPLPQGDSITGAQAVDFSKKARFLANQLEKDSSNPFASNDAQMYRDAASAVEDAVQSKVTADGNPQLAAAWDGARTYYAKTYSVQNALDGAGNVNVTALKRQLLKNKPLSGNLETLANLGAQYPQAFKLTPSATPQVGLMRRIAGRAAPGLGTAAGSLLGGSVGVPTLGAIAGNAVGENVAGRLLPP